METRNSLEGLKALIGVPSTAATRPQGTKNGSAPDASTLGADHATLSSAGSEISQAAADSGVRLEKVAAVQAALAGGTYNVPASAVAEKVIESMLGPSEWSGN
jgi:negative regulator of flagellin synthesis FlgM